MSKKGVLMWRASIFDVTINTNKSLVGATPEKIEELKNSLERYIRVVFDRDRLPSLFTNTKNEKIPLDSVRNITVKSVIEANVHGRSFLHSHTIVRVEHKISVRLNLAVIKSTLYKFLEKSLTLDGEFKKPYVNVKVASDAAWNMENYVKSDNRDAEFIKEI